MEVGFLKMSFKLQAVKILLMMKVWLNFWTILWMKKMESDSWSVFHTAVMAEVNNNSENEDVTSLEAAIDEKIYEDEYSLFI